VIKRFLVGPGDSIRLDSFRAAFGAVLVAFMAHWWLDDALEWLTVDGFHLSAAAAGPSWLSPPPLPVSALAPFGLVFFAVLVAFTLGYRLPWSAAAALLLTVYVSHVDPLASFTPNNLFIMGLALLTVAPAGAWWSVGGRTPAPVSVWPVRVLQATLLAMYFTSGACKVLWGDWLHDSHVLYSQVQGPYRTDAAAWLLRHLPIEAWNVMQSLSLSLELLAPVLFTVRRLRPVGFALGAAMHAGIALTMDEIGYLSLQMLCFYLLFVDERTLHRIRERVAAVGSRQIGARGSPSA
jgi:vitamin K-dependent gamma-carboxylase-like protein